MTGMELVEGWRAAECSMEGHVGLFHFFGWNWVFTHCVIKKTNRQTKTKNQNKTARTLAQRTKRMASKQKHAEHVKTNQIASVGGKVLCYKYCKTPFSAYKKNRVAFQTTEMAGQAFSSCARNWKQCERFSLNGRGARLGLGLKSKAPVSLLPYMRYFSYVMQDSPGPKPFTLSCNLEVCPGYISASDLSAFTFG